MHKFSRLLMGFLLAVTLLAGAALISPSVAHAACGGTGCNGHDPHNYGCDAGAYPILSKSLIDQTGTNVGTVYMEWSPACQTNWGRIVMRSNGTDPWCIIASVNQCWSVIGVSMYLLGFDSSGHYNGQETYLPLSQDGPDHCIQNCGGSTIFYGNMYYAPNAEVMIVGYADSEYNISSLGADSPQACVYTGSSWKYTYNKPFC